MPRLSGPELAEQLRILRPALEVLFMSGYNDSRLVNRGVAQSSAHLLVKPFTPDQPGHACGRAGGCRGLSRAANGRPIGAFPDPPCGLSSLAGGRRCPTLLV